MPTHDPRVLPPGYPYAKADARGLGAAMRREMLNACKHHLRDRTNSTEQTGVWTTEYLAILFSRTHL